MIIKQVLLLILILHFHSELHDKFKEYPPAPGTLAPELEWLSDYQKEIGQRTGIINHNKFKQFSCIGS